MSKKKTSLSVIVFFLVACAIFLIGSLSLVTPACVDIDEALPHYEETKGASPK